MTTKLYYKSRFLSYNLWQGKYSLEYSFKQERPDYEWVTINSFVIPDDKYTDLVKNNWTVIKCLIVVEIDDTQINWKTVADIEYDINTYYAWRFQLAQLTSEQVITWVKQITTLTEDVEVPWKFLITEAQTEPEIRPAQYLIIT